MANEPNPNDPYRAGDPYRASPNRDSNPADDPYRTKSRSSSRDEDAHRAVRLDNELQVDPELGEGPSSGGRMALFAVGIAVILGVVFYGLNNSSINQASTSPAATPAATAQNAPMSPPAAPPGMRDVTPRNNSAPGMTTGAASPDPASSNPKPLTPRSADPKAPPAPAPSGGTE
jgi:hypothetical protein